VTILGPLAGEPSKRMTKEEFQQFANHCAESWNGDVILEKKTVDLHFNEIIWRRKCLHWVETASKPLVKDPGRT